MIFIWMSVQMMDSYPLFKKYHFAHLHPYAYIVGHLQCKVLLPLQINYILHLQCIIATLQGTFSDL